jgi:hypothetical protein
MFYGYVKVKDYTTNMSIGYDMDNISLIEFLLAEMPTVPTLTELTHFSGAVLRPATII